MNHLFSVFLCIILFSTSLLAEYKKNVCAITLNSTEEFEAFKKKLPKEEWNFIELTQSFRENSEKNWLKYACEKKVKCDILIISGHFGGTFFGSTNLKLSTEELETASCDQSCAGILHHPKEVFLFGCNTLATKNKDHRTPEEYMRVLRDDGFSQAQASQIVSFRYSGFGDSFQSRMSAVFAKTPRIYGFNSVGPSGKTIEPLLNNYLDKSKKYYSEFQNQSTNTQKNYSFFDSLKNTAVAQTTGSYLNLRNPEEKPYCYIHSHQIQRHEKIKYIKSLFEDGKAIGILNHIDQFLKEIEKVELSISETNLLNEISNNAKIKNDLNYVLELTGDIYIPLKINVLKTLFRLKLIDQTDLKKSYLSLLNLNTPFNETRRDMICSSEINLDLQISDIPEKRWSEPEFVATILCFKNYKIGFQNKFSEFLDQKNTTNSKTAAIWYFNEVQTKDSNIQFKIATLLNDKNENVRLSAAIVLKNLKPQSKEVQALIVKSLLNEKSENVLNHLCYFIKKATLKPELMSEFFLNFSKSENKLIIEKLLI